MPASPNHTTTGHSGANGRSRRRAPASRALAEADRRSEPPLQRLYRLATSRLPTDQEARVLAEALLERGDEPRLLAVAGYFGEYGAVAHRLGLSFLLEAAAHDVVQLIERALELGSASVDPLLEVLLDLDQEIKEESQEDSLLGVRRSQIQLAALFLELGQEARARRIVDDLKGERVERLERLRTNLESDDRPQYWELTDRGTNFAYLAPERRVHLDQLFAWLRE